MAKDTVHTLMQENDSIKKTIDRFENSEYAGAPGMSKRIKELRGRIQENKEAIKNALANPDAAEEGRLRKAVLGDETNEEFLGTTNKRGN